MADVDSAMAGEGRRGGGGAPGSRTSSAVPRRSRRRGGRGGAGADDAKAKAGGSAMERAAAEAAEGMARIALDDERRTTTQKREAANAPLPGTNATHHRDPARVDGEALGKLPAWVHRSSVLESVARHRVTCISGETGCGKSTAIPIALLSDAQARGEKVCIAVTQPRRLAATSLARRVASLCGESDVGGLVGFAVGQEARVSERTKLIFCTTGWLLRSLSGALDGAEASSVRYTHVVMDEAHERTVDADFLSLVIKSLTASRTKRQHTFRVVVMSATLQAGEMSAYFAQRGERVPPPIHVGASLFPVDVIMLDDLARGAIDQNVSSAASRLVRDQRTRTENNGAPKPELGLAASTLINSIVRAATLGLSCENAVLVFLPGIAEIDAVARAIETNGRGVGRGETNGRGAGKGGGGGEFSYHNHNFVICPLHSHVEPEDQLKALDPAPPGKVKVVLSTTVAESSVTIPDVYLVIDACLIKGVDFDDVRNQAVLRMRWASQASAKQRAGRAGRVRPGRCIRLVSMAHFESVRPYDEAEMLRTSLDEVVLSARVLLPSLGDATQVLATAIDPPPPTRVNAALTQLAADGALHDASGSAQATALGLLASLLPVGVKGAKMILLGIALGIEMDAVVLATAFAQPLDPFLLPSGAFEKNQAKLLADVTAVLDRRFELAMGEGSDAVVYLQAFDQWLQLEYRNAHETWMQCLHLKRMASWHAMAADVAKRLMKLSPKSGIQVSAAAMTRLQRLADSRRKQHSASKAKGVTDDATSSEKTAPGVPFQHDTDRIRLMVFASLTATGALIGVPADPPPSKAKETMAAAEAGRVRLTNIPEALCSAASIAKALEPTKLLNPTVHDTKKGTAWLSFATPIAAKAPPKATSIFARDEEGAKGDCEEEDVDEDVTFADDALDIPRRAKVLASLSHHIARRDEKDKTVLRVLNPNCVPGSDEPAEIALGRVAFDFSVQWRHMEHGKVHLGRWSVMLNAAYARSAHEPELVRVLGGKPPIIACYASMLAIMSAAGNNTTYVVEHITALPPFDTYSALLWACVAPRDPKMTLLVAPNPRGSAGAIGLRVESTTLDGRRQSVKLAFDPESSLNPKHIFRRVKALRRKLDSLFVHGTRGGAQRRAKSTTEEDDEEKTSTRTLMEEYAKLLGFARGGDTNARGLRRQNALWDEPGEQILPAIGGEADNSFNPDERD